MLRFSLFLFVCLDFVSAAWSSDPDEDFGLSWLVGAGTLILVLVIMIEGGLIILFAMMRRAANTDIQLAEKKMAKLLADRAHYQQAVIDWEVKVQEAKKKLSENMKALRVHGSEEERAIEAMMKKLADERRALAAQEDLQQADRQQKLAQAVNKHKRSRPRQS